MAEPAEPSRYDAFDMLATMVAVVRFDGALLFVNSMFENVAGVSRRALMRSSLFDWFADSALLRETLTAVARNEIATGRFDGVMRRSPVAAHEQLPVHVIVTQIEPGADRVLIELLEIEQQTRQDREERALGQVQANKELIRNLAHEIKNPLGGIRGAAQLLEMEVDSRELTEYTQVIIHEADRLQALVDRLLAPHRKPHVVSDVNIHEVCERVRSVVLAEYPMALSIERDYDASLPELRGDKEQLIQVIMNLVRNAAQALHGQGRILLRTRVARQVTIAKKRHKLALDLHVIDNGPGIPEAIRDRIFFPLVSGREGGSGLGLTIAQTFISQHNGTIDCESVPGRTVFTITLPLEVSRAGT